MPAIEVLTFVAACPLCVVLNIASSLQRARRQQEMWQAAEKYFNL
jgi:hypothetical protein